MIKERAAEGLLVHGPIITFVDEQALHSFARAMVTGPSRKPGRAARRGSRKRETPPT